MAASDTASHAIGYLFALSAGAINGVLIAYVEIPPCSPRWGWPLVYGFARYALVASTWSTMPASAGHF